MILHAVDGGKGENLKSGKPFVRPHKKIIVERAFPFSHGSVTFIGMVCSHAKFAMGLDYT